MIPLVSTRQNNFNALRMAMAILVIWSHCFALYLGTEENEPIALLTKGALDSGKIAVDVFFMISGFLILKSFDRSTSAWSYLGKRIARIYPGYLAAIGICAFVMLPLVGDVSYSIGTAFETLWRNLLLQGWFIESRAFEHNRGAHIVNGSLWSISYEFWCYLGILALGLLSGMRVRRAIVLAAFALIIVLDVWTQYTGKIWGGGLLGRVLGWPNIWFRMAPCFLLGMLVYLYQDRIPRSWGIACAAVFVLVVGVRLSPEAVSFLVPLCLGYLVFYAAFGRPIFDPARYGDYSYGTYLYAWPIQQLLIAYGSLSFPLFVCAAIVLSVLAGAGSWYAVERWFLRSKRVSMLAKQTDFPAHPRSG
ncbi:MAG: acyltransferase [Steroidobacteraceae bacterium]